MLAPNAGGVAGADGMAVSMVAGAAVVEAALVIPAEPDPPAKVAPLLKPKCVAAESVETMALPPAPDTRAVNVSVPSEFWTALALVLAVVREPYATPEPGPAFTAAAKLAKVAEVVAPISTSFAVVEAVRDVLKV